MLSIVIDTYDPEVFIKKYALGVAKYGKEHGVKIIFRPDSGDVYDQTVRLYRLMKEHSLENDTGVIIGESITEKKIIQYDKKFQEDNIPLPYVRFGIGAGFFKDIDRDWTGFAMKTSYSNNENRMKFSGTPIKRSIPGIVNIVKDQNDNLVVDYAINGLYKDVFFFNRELKRPNTWIQTWREIQEIALSQNGTIKKLQNNIKYSFRVEQEIKRIHEKYLKEEITVGI